MDRCRDRLAADLPRSEAELAHAPERRRVSLDIPFPQWSSPCANVPDFRFKHVRIWNETPDQAFGEYGVEALVLSTRKVYKPTHAGRLVAENGKIKLMREALDTLAASRAFRNVNRFAGS